MSPRQRPAGSRRLHLGVVVRKDRVVVRRVGTEPLIEDGERHVPRARGVAGLASEHSTARVDSSAPATCAPLDRGRAQALRALPVVSSSLATVSGIQPASTSDQACVRTLWSVRRFREAPNRTSGHPPAELLVPEGETRCSALRHRRSSVTMGAWTEPGDSRPSSSPASSWSSRARLRARHWRGSRPSGRRPQPRWPL